MHFITRFLEKLNCILYIELYIYNKNSKYILIKLWIKLTIILKYFIPAITVNNFWYYFNIQIITSVNGSPKWGVRLYTHSLVFINHVSHIYSAI